MIGVLCRPVVGGRPTISLEKKDYTVPLSDSRPAWRSRALLVALAMAQPMVDVPDPLLIEGETGTGKTTLARQIHVRSGRKGPFLETSIPSFPETLLPGLFDGYARGAFTGAVKDTPGFIEAANAGTLFLDELGEAPPWMQAALLRVLETREVIRLGEVRPRPVSARIIAATNKHVDEPALIRFDLVQRFGPYRVTLRPLRDYPEDIEPLFCQYLAEAEAEVMCGSPTVTLDSGVERLLLAVPWKGNFRQIKLEARRAGGNSRGARPIKFEHLSPFLQAEGEVALGGITKEAARRRAEVRLHARVLREMEQGNIRAVAAQLKVSERRVFQILADPTAERTRMPRDRDDVADSEVGGKITA